LTLKPFINPWHSESKK